MSAKDPSGGPNGYVTKAPQSAVRRAQHPRWLRLGRPQEAVLTELTTPNVLLRTINPPYEEDFQFNWEGLLIKSAHDGVLSPKKPAVACFGDGYCNHVEPMWTGPRWSGLRSEYGGEGIGRV